jgi:hypothetical protein
MDVTLEIITKTISSITVKITSYLFSLLKNRQKLEIILDPIEGKDYLDIYVENQSKKGEVQVGVVEIFAVSGEEKQLISEQKLPTTEKGFLPQKISPQTRMAIKVWAKTSVITHSKKYSHIEITIKPQVGPILKTQTFKNPGYFELNS